MRILLVDDQPSVTAAVRSLLRDETWEVLEAHSGEAGLDCVNERAFDVIISDELMPGMSGVEFLTEVARISPGSVRILLTGHANQVPATSAINDARIHQLLTKPCSRDELVSCILSGTSANQVPLPSERTSSSDESPNPLTSQLDEVLDSLTLVFQPILSTRDRVPYGYEVLCRSDYPGIPHPGVLFDLAEDASRTLDIEARIRELISESLIQLPDGAHLFVNLHPHTLGDEAFFDESNPLFSEPEKIVLEVTERASLDGVGDLQPKIVALKERGFRIAVDDLGAGYAGLNTFALLQPDIVKLDIELIRDINDSSTNRKVVDSMVRLGRDLDFLSVAEGIENELELQTLIDLGCDLLQGFLLARPAKSFTVPVWPTFTTE